MGYAKGPSDRGPGKSKSTNTGGGGSTYGKGPINRSPHKNHNNQKDNRYKGGGAWSAATSRAQNRKPPIQNNDYQAGEFGTTPTPSFPHPAGEFGSTPKPVESSPYSFAAHVKPGIDYHTDITTDEADEVASGAGTVAAFAAPAPGLGALRFGNKFTKAIDKYIDNSKLVKSAVKESGLSVNQLRGIGSGVTGVGVAGTAAVASQAEATATPSAGLSQNAYGNNYGHTPSQTPSVSTPSYQEPQGVAPGISFGDDLYYEAPTPKTPGPKGIIDTTKPKLGIKRQTGITRAPLPIERHSPTPRPKGIGNKTAEYANPGIDRFGRSPLPNPRPTPKPDVRGAQLPSQSRGGYTPAPPGYSAPRLQNPVVSDPYGGSNVYRATHERHMVRRNPTGQSNDLKSEKAGTSLGIPQGSIDTTGVVQDLIRHSGFGNVNAVPGVPGAARSPAGVEPGNPGGVGPVANTGASNSPSALRRLLNEKERRGLYKTGRDLPFSGGSRFAVGNRRVF